MSLSRLNITFRSSLAMHLYGARERDMSNRQIACCFMVRCFELMTMHDLRAFVCASACLHLENYWAREFHFVHRASATTITSCQFQFETSIKIFAIQILMDSLINWLTCTHRITRVTICEVFIVQSNDTSVLFGWWIFVCRLIEVINSKWIQYVEQIIGLSCRWMDK